MHVIDQGTRESAAHIVARGSCRFHIEGPQIRFWVSPNAIHHRQAGQQQHFLLVRHGTEGGDVDSHGVDADE